MGQPTFIQKIDGSGIGVHSLTLTPGAATTAGNMLLVGVVMTPTGAESPQSVAGIKDSAGDVFNMSVDTGVPINPWVGLGGNTHDGVHIEWWACKSIASITSLIISITGTGGAAGAQDIIAILLEYSGANGLTNPIFQPIQPDQNTITTQDIVETVATFPNSGAELMIGLYAMLNDTFNASPLQGTARSTNSVSIPPSLSYQIVEQGTVQPGDTDQVITVSGEEITVVGGALNISARSATQLATAGNVAASSMQCLYIVISGGLILNTQPGFSDQPDSVLAAGNFALGLQLAKINGNAALGMCRMEFFQGVYTNGQTVNLPVSSVDGYQYSITECVFLWQVTNSANPGTGWITGPTSLWFCGWNVDQETGLVTCDEWYRNAANSAESQDGSLLVFIVAQRQQQTLTAAGPPSWTQQNASLFAQDLAYSSDVLTNMNENAKFSVLGQEVVSMGEFYNGQTIPRPVSPADGHLYAYSEVSFVYCWRWTTGQLAYAAPAWEPYEGLGALYASINPSTGVVTCGIGWSEHDGNNYAFDSTYGRLAVFAFCQRARSGTPSEVGNKFAEIPNTLFYPGSLVPASIGAQLCRNINEAACSPEFFGPTTYLPGATIPVPTSAIDGYVYQRSELIYLWQWYVMDTFPGGPLPPSVGSGSHMRTPLFSASIDQTTGLVSTDIWHLAPGGPYTEYLNTAGILSVLVIGFRTSQQTEVSGTGVQAPSDAGSAVADQLSPGTLTVNGI